MDLTPAELTVLGLVIEKPSHGYDLERVIEQRGIRRWTDIGFSSIYYLLAKLEGRGLLAVEGGRSGPKSRRVFHATEEGRRVAAADTLAFISDARPVSHPVLVGLANLSLVDAGDYEAALHGRLAQVESRVVAVEAALAAQTPLSASAREVFSYSHSLLQAERSWLAERVQVHRD